MPLLSISIDETVLSLRRDQLVAALPAIRDMLCTRLDVPQELSHLTIVSVISADTQHKVNADMRVLKKDSRPRDLIDAVAGDLQQQLSRICDTPAAVRVAIMRPDEYLARR